MPAGAADAALESDAVAHALVAAPIAGCSRDASLLRRPSRRTGKLGLTQRHAAEGSWAVWAPGGHCRRIADRLCPSLDRRTATSPLDVMPWLSSASRPSGPTSTEA